jgi:predicted unusual protein kinase regulating ubiquinone biosynthesis (AarF/ABC1/UbiB family)
MAEQADGCMLNLGQNGSSQHLLFWVQIVRMHKLRSSVTHAAAGESVAKYIREPSPFNTQIVALGVDCYLKMLLADNFVHTDLHPGNIMVRVRGVRHICVAGWQT